MSEKGGTADFGQWIKLAGCTHVALADDMIVSR